MHGSPRVGMCEGAGASRPRARIRAPRCLGETTMTTRRVLLGAIGCAAIMAGCRNLPGPTEVTPDGLQRVPSRRAGGVFRLPGAPFAQYRRLILEPVTVSFVEGWEKSHP